MGKPKTWSNGLTSNSDAVYTDRNGVEWDVTKGVLGSGLLRAPWTSWRASISDPQNKYELPANETLYTEDTREDIQKKVDDAAYGWAITKGDLVMQGGESQSAGGGFGIVVLIAGLYFLFGKKGR